MTDRVTDKLFSLEEVDFWATGRNIKSIEETLANKLAKQLADTMRDLEEAKGNFKLLGNETNELRQIIGDTMRENERKDKALLLAARWFKLYMEDKTRYEHPASDADLAGMFDAMQEARLEQRNDE